MRKPRLKPAPATNRGRADPDDPPDDLPDDTDAPPEEESGPPSEVQPCDDTRDVCAMDSILGDYIAQEGLDETNYRASLYQFDKLNKQKQHLLDVSVGTILSPHDVGMAYGSGDYRYVVTWPRNLDEATKKPKIKAFRFSIGQSYDVKRAMAGAVPPPTGIQPPAAAHAGPDPITAALQIVGAMVQMQRQSAPPERNPAVEMAQMHTAMQQVLQQSSLQYIEFMKETRRRLMNLDSEEPYLDEEGDDDMDDNSLLVEQIKALAIEYLPKILGDGIGGKAAAAAIKTMPQFKRIVKDGPTLAHLLSELEKEFGKEKVDAACARLKVKRPE